MKSDVIKFVLRCMVFFIIAGCLGLAAGRYDNDATVAPNRNVARVRASADHRNPDILFLGSSYSINAINAPLFGEAGYAAYNLAVSSSSAGFYEVLLRDHIRSTGSKPKLVCIELSPMTFSPASDNWTDYAIHRYLNEPLSNEIIALRFREIARYPTLFANSVRKSIGNAITLGTRGAERDATKFDELVIEMNDARGFHEEKGEDSDAVWEAEKSFFLPLNELEFQKKRSARLAHLLQTLEEESIPFVLYEMPTSEVRSFYSAEYNAEMEQHIARLTEDYHVVRIEDGMFEAKKYFRNTDHMNDVGARAYSEFLLAQLGELARQGAIPLNPPRR